MYGLPKVFISHHLPPTTEALMYSILCIPKIYNTLPQTSLSMGSLHPTCALSICPPTDSIYKWFLKPAAAKPFTNFMQPLVQTFPPYIWCSNYYMQLLESLSPPDITFPHSSLLASTWSVHLVAYIYPSLSQGDINLIQVLPHLK